MKLTTFYSLTLLLPLHLSGTGCRASNEITCYKILTHILSPITFFIGYSYLTETYDERMERKRRELRKVASATNPRQLANTIFYRKQRMDTEEKKDKLERNRGKRESKKHHRRKVASIKGNCPCCCRRQAIAS